MFRRGLFAHMCFMKGCTLNAWAQSLALLQLHCVLSQPCSPVITRVPGQPFWGLFCKGQNSVFVLGWQILRADNYTSWKEKGINSSVKCCGSVGSSWCSHSEGAMSLSVVSAAASWIISFSNLWQSYQFVVSINYIWGDHHLFDPGTYISNRDVVTGIRNKYYWGILVCVHHWSVCECLKCYSLALQY